MVKNRREGKMRKRIVSAVLTAVLSVGLLTGVPANDMSEVQAATTLNNPRTGSDGVVTWDCVWFGRYYQSDATGKEKDPIKWRVLSVDGNDALLLADKNLDCMQYHSDDRNFEYTTWATCTLRSWMNGLDKADNSQNKSYSKNNFIDCAFVDKEQTAIRTTTIVNSDGGGNTADKLFLLSADDMKNPAYGFATKFSIQDPARIRTNTAYVAAGGTSGSSDTKDVGKSDRWWLRTLHETYQNNVKHVDTVGKVQTQYQPSELSRGVVMYDMSSVGVCPALHIDLSETEVWSYAGTVSTDGTSTAGEKAPVIEEEEEKPTVADPNTGASYEIPDVDDKNKTVAYVPADDAKGTVIVPDYYYSPTGVTYKVTAIADNAFKNNKKITKVVLGDNITKIGKNAFSGCTKLKTVEMGKNITTMGDKAFYKCTQLNSITIPSKVNKIGKQAFYGCKKLKNITVKTTKLTSKNVGSNAFKNVYSKVTVKVPSKKLSTYKKLFKSKGLSSKAKITK